MRAPARLMLAMVLVLAGSVSAGSSFAQQAVSADSVLADQNGEAPLDSIQLVFEREVFTYPSFERRNPFRPLTGEEDLGPRFEDMILLGVVLSVRSEASIAVLGARPPGATGDQPPSRIFRLRSGESLGNVRVLEIRRREVVFAVEDFGITETRMLTIVRAAPPPMPPPDEIPPEAPIDESSPQSVNEPGADMAMEDTLAGDGANGNGGRS